MTKPEISAIAPLFIVKHVPAALAFYRDRFGFDITSAGVFTIGSWNVDDVLVAAGACP